MHVIMYIYKCTHVHQNIMLLLCVHYACTVYVHINSGLHSNTLLLQPVTPKLLMELCVQLAVAMKHLECFRIIHPDLQLRTC